MGAWIKYLPIKLIGRCETVELWAEEILKQIETNSKCKKWLKENKFNIDHIKNVIESARIITLEIGKAGERQKQSEGY